MKKRYAVYCPICGTQLLARCDQCKGLIILCPTCEASILIDFELGNARISVRTAEKSKQGVEN